METETETVAVTEGKLPNQQGVSATCSRFRSTLNSTLNLAGLFHLLRYCHIGMTRKDPLFNT